MSFKFEVTADKFNTLSQLLLIASSLDGAVIAHNELETVLLFKFPSYEAVGTFIDLIKHEPIIKATPFRGEDFHSTSFVSVVI